MAKGIYVVTPSGNARGVTNNVRRMVVVAQSESAAKSAAAADSDAGAPEPWTGGTATLLDPSALNDDSVQLKGSF